MRILHIAEFGERATGIGTVVERLFKEQILLGHETKIVSINDNIAYHHLPISVIKHKEEFDFFVREWQPDAVLFHSIWAMPYIGFSKILIKKRVPYGIMMHGANSKENHKKSRIKKIISNYIWFNSFLRRAATIVYLSTQEYENCVSKDINPNYSILPNGCDAINVDIDNKELNKPIRIVYLGRIIMHHKGLDILLESLKRLKEDSFSKARFFFYGNETDVDIISFKEKICELSELATFEGPAYNEIKDTVLKNADIFILTSRYEGMPMGVLEAISYGVPCILTPGTNMQEEIVNSGAGWGADFDEKSISNTIKKACAEMSNGHIRFRRAALNLSRNYNWEVIAKKSVEIMSLISEYYK